MNKEMSGLKRGFSELLKDLPVLLGEKKPFTISTFAEMYGVTDLEVCRAMPEGMVAITDGSRFEEIWNELAGWEKATVIIQHYGSAFEISTKICSGVKAHGYYNIMGECTFGGHIKDSEIYSIGFSTMPFMGLESYSVLFFNKTGSLIFSVYAGRENRVIIESVKSSFLQMKEMYSRENNQVKKSLVVYSSLTGNTKKIAEAVQSILPNSEICSIDEVPANLDEYYFTVPCYWVDRGMPDAKSKALISSLKNMNVGLFGTLGAYPDSPHAKGCINDSEGILKTSGKNNNVMGSFLCLGKIDPKLLDYMGKFMGDSHPMTPERKARLLEAQTHPDENDINNAKSVMQEYIKRLGL